jgi:hypothetical protein
VIPCRPGVHASCKDRSRSPQPAAVSGSKKSGSGSAWGRSVTPTGVEADVSSMVSTIARRQLAGMHTCVLRNPSAQPAADGRAGAASTSQSPTPCTRAGPRQPRGGAAQARGGAGCAGVCAAQARGGAGARRGHSAQEELALQVGARAGQGRAGMWGWGGWGWGVARVAGMARLLRLPWLALLPPAAAAPGGGRRRAQGWGLDHSTAAAAAAPQVPAPGAPRPG